MKSLTSAIALIVVERATGRGLFATLVLLLIGSLTASTHTVDLSMMLGEKRGETNFLSFLRSRGGATSLLDFKRFRGFPVHDDISPSATSELRTEQIADVVGMKKVATRTVAGLSSVLVKEGLFNDTPPPLLTVPVVGLDGIDRGTAAAGVVVVVKDPERVSDRGHLRAGFKRESV
jgi:uncharacterized membrane protein YeaQ/YmgE (transglycosylase-associated protein family)